MTILLNISVSICIDNFYETLVTGVNVFGPGTYGNLLRATSAYFGSLLLSNGTRRKHGPLCSYGLARQTMALKTPHIHEAHVKDNIIFLF